MKNNCARKNNGQTCVGRVSITHGFFENKKFRRNLDYDVLHAD